MLLDIYAKLFYEFIACRGVAKEKSWWVAQRQFADKQTSLEPTLTIEKTFLEFYQQTTLTSTIDVRQICRQAKYWGTPGLPMATLLIACKVTYRKIITSTKRVTKYFCLKG